MTVTRRIRSPGRARNKPLKPLRAGMPGESGEPSVTMLVCFILFRTRGCGCIGHLPHALCFPGRTIHAQLGRIAPRECEGVSDEYERATQYVVPANAGTHNHLSLLEQKALATLPKREAAPYGSPRSRGRRFLILSRRGHNAARYAHNSLALLNANDVTRRVF